MLTSFLLILLAVAVAFILRIQGSPVSAKVAQPAVQRNPLLSKVFLPGDSGTIVMSDAGGRFCRKSFAIAFLSKVV